MNILAFESSCDETAVAVLRADEEQITVLASTVATQIDIHRLYGGVVPEIASRAHIEQISPLCYEALRESGLSLSEIDLIAVTANPGLIGALLVGVNFAKSLAAANHIPLVAVDHIKGHIAAAYLNTSEPPKPPFLALALSGGHTSIYRVAERLRHMGCRQVVLVHLIGYQLIGNLRLVEQACRICLINTLFRHILKSCTKLLKFGGFA